MRPFSQRLAFAPATASAATDPALGDLPVWKLEDLYPAPNSDAFRNDMEKALADAKAFEAKWKGGLEAAAGQTGPRGIGAEAVRLLLRRIADPRAVVEHVEIPGQLVVRDS